MKRATALLAVVAVCLTAATGAAAVTAPSTPETAPVDRAITQIRAALAAPGCNAKLKALFPSYYGKIPPSACTYLRDAFGSFSNPRGAAYGTGAEIDFERGGRRYAAILAVNSQVQFDVLFVSARQLLPGGGIGGREQPAYERSASTAVQALRTANCPLFLSVASRTLGIGADKDASVCKAIKTGKLRTVLGVDQNAAPVSMGGNESYAFFGLQAAGRFYTIVMAKQPRLPGLPVNAALYSFVGAYPLAQ